MIQGHSRQEIDGDTMQRELGYRIYLFGETGGEEERKRRKKEEREKKGGEGREERQKLLFRKGEQRERETAGERGGNWGGWGLSFKGQGTQVTEKVSQMITFPSFL